MKTPVKAILALVISLMTASSCVQEIMDYKDRFEDLEQRVSTLEAYCQQMNGNIASLQSIIAAMQTGDYITSVTPLTENGITIGYTITFAKAAPITIYHGQNGKDGANGKDGVNGQDGKDGKDGADGHTPVIGVKQDTDGIWYWTIDGEWLLDADNQKVKAVGIDGKDGADGKDGVDGKDGTDGKDGVDGNDGANGVNGQDGQDGITPQLKIEDDYWYVSVDNGQTWSRLGKATGADGKDGKDGQDGKDGDSMFQSVTVTETDVTFVTADGQTFVIKRASALSIKFDSADLVVMGTNSTRDIHYTITSGIDDITIEALSSADIKVKVVKTDAKTGALHVKTGAAIDEYSKVVVLVSNGSQAIMRTLNFEEEAIEVEENTTKEVTEEGGEVTLEFFSNVPCHAVIPEDAQSWISVAPETKAMTKQTIGLIVQPNTGLARSATINVVGEDNASNIVLSYTVTQDLGGIWKEGTVPPNNEIWYTTTDGDILEPYDKNAFGARLISNTYSSGKGIMQFEGVVTMFASKSAGGLATPFGAPGLGSPEKLSSIFLPNSVKTIGSCAFYYCRNMNQIGMPNELECIGSDAFLGCQSLVRIEIPYSVTEVGVAAFGDCPSLTSFDGDCSLISEDRKCIIVDGALVGFASCGIINYSIPEGIVEIPAYTFLGSSLESISFPSSLVSIGNMAFDFSKLKEVTLNEGLKTIEHAAFRGCPLITVHIPSTVEKIEDEAFSCDEMERYTGKFASSDGKCLIVDGRIISFAYKGLKSYTLPSETRIVGSNLFNSPLLEYITIPEGVEEIGGNAFTCCNLKSINIPSTVSVIGDWSCGPFTYCVNLESITGKYSTEDHRCLIKDNRLISFAPKGLTDYSIPEGVVSIGPSAFEEHQLTNISLPSTLTQFEDRAFRASGLTSVTIPESVSYIGDQAFFQCKRLNSIYVRSYIPPVFGWQEDYNPGDIFDIADDGIIYVPSTSVQLYKDTWVTYASRIVGYEYSDLPNPDFYISSDYSADGAVTTLQQSTTGNGVDLVFMGDAFSDRQIADGTYANVMQKATDAFFSEEPYKSMKNCFNVYTVNVVSATEGYEHSGQALSTGHGDGTFVYGDDAKVIEYAKKAISEDRLDDAVIIVMMNEDAYAGTCFMYNAPSGDYGRGLSIAYFPTSSDTDTFNGLVSHEAGGHGFAKLADEYAYESMGAMPAEAIASLRENESHGWWKNADFTSDPAQVKWAQFISDERYASENIGCYEGAFTYWTGAWRPTENSIMRYNTGGFNAPSRYAIWYRIGKLAYGESWEGSYEDFVAYDAVNRTSAAAVQRNNQLRRAAQKPLPRPTPPVVVGHGWREKLQKAK